MSPVYVNGVEQGGATALTYVELAPVTNSVAAGTAIWLDWDLSASIPANAIAAEIILDGLAFTGDTLVGVRKNGSALTRSITLTSGKQVANMTVLLDAGRIVEVLRNPNFTVNYRLIGYWI